MKFYYVALLALFETTGCHRGSAAAGAASTDCIDPSKVNPEGMCTMIYQPVCGCDGKTYSNACVATNAGVRTHKPGPCPAVPTK